MEDFLPDVVGPVRGDGRDEQGLQFDIAEEERAVHAG